MLIFPVAFVAVLQMLQQSKRCFISVCPIVVGIYVLCCDSPVCMNVSFAFALILLALPFSVGLFPLFTNFVLSLCSFF